MTAETASVTQLYSSSPYQDQEEDGLLAAFLNTLAAAAPSLQVLPVHHLPALGVVKG